MRVNSAVIRPQKAYLQRGTSRWSSVAETALLQACCAAADLLQLFELGAGTLLHEHVELLAEPLLGALLLPQRLIRCLKHLCMSAFVMHP